MGTATTTTTDPTPTTTKSRNVRRKLVTLFAAAGLLAGGLGVISTETAHAADFDEQMYTDDIEPDGHVEFTRNGDKVVLCDRDRGDGQWIRLVVGPERNPHYVLEVRKTTWFNGCKVRDAGDGPKFDLPEYEDERMRFRICLMGGTPGAKHCDRAFWATDWPN